MNRIYLIPTPIGNLEDITLRAVRMMRSCDLLVAEDTRHTLNLLKHYDIHKPLYPLHQHNEHQKVNYYLQQVVNGKSLGVITDAGTPGISDPGFLIVREAIKLGISVETLPGPTAFVPALVSSGFPCDRFVFEGFLPVKKGRRARLKELVSETRTMIFYEAPHKFNSTIKEFEDIFGFSRPACLIRELSKIHEEIIRKTIGEIQIQFANAAPKGELVLIVGGRPVKKNSKDDDKEETSDEV